METDDTEKKDQRISISVLCVYTNIPVTLIVTTYIAKHSQVGNICNS